MYRINDAHIHLGPSGPWKPDFDPSTTLAQVLEFKKKNNIDKCVIFPNPSVGVEYPERNDYITKTAKEYPKQFIPFGRVDPRYKKEAIKEIMRLAEIGVVGIKLHPVVECFRPDHPFFFDIYQEIVNHGMFIVSHSDDKGFGKASYWKPVCDKFNNLKLILCHLNEDCIGLLENYDNVFADISGHTFLKFSHELSELNTRKILFGSDYPYVKNISRHLEIINNSNLSKLEIENILYQNFNRLFKDFISEWEKTK
jgi:predicted TIM-barrel fold metal-dependent hydrolase